MAQAYLINIDGLPFQCHTVATVGMTNAQSPGTFYAIIPIRGSEPAVLFGVGASLMAALLTVHVLTGRYVIADEQVRSGVN